MGFSPSEFLVRELRRQRCAAGLTQDALGERVHYSNTHVSAVETGTKQPRPEYLKAVDEALQTGGLFIHLWEELVRDSGAPVWLREWIEVEREARTLRWYEQSWVPGLLQTEAYARATMAGELFPPDEIDRLVQARLARQELLNGPRPPLLVAVLDEQVLIRPTGPGQDFMPEQVAHLLACAELPHIQVHVVPAEVGMNPGLGGQFIIAELRDGSRVAHADNQLSVQITNEAEHIATLDARWERIRGDALTRQHSLELIRKAATAWT
ncbi:helix-turn-helix transcriptional regulator [Micromonospora echinospora]|uniref:helix-turn-helix domain-containing protein n=1 Tax=Micromonospora echinospora TaxID=1877 RepID=UPI0033E8D9F9